jgi:catechol 2,3-dioxygenase-like lactoylglutathione lyase family enzyme|tara:strand:+ start:646 stop:1032 length:387 start_codon:yes stop_codon:yes gene_type:complete
MRLDHITIRTGNLDRARRFYRNVLALEEGYRPPFSDFPPGAWFYNSQNDPVVHLSTSREQTGGLLAAMDHIAFRTTDLENTIARLRENGVDYKVEEVSEVKLTQVFFHDPDGVRIEVNFVDQESEAEN